MSALAPTLQAFFTDRLVRQRHASGHTIAAYRDTMRLLLGYATERTGRPPSRLDLADLDAYAIEHRLAHYTELAAGRCPSLHGKTVTAHVLRHTTAMRLLHAGVDTSVIALWLGHVSVETTQIYLHADLELKEKALARTRPPNGRTGRYQPPDHLLAWLEAL